MAARPTKVCSAVRVTTVGLAALDNTGVDCDAAEKLIAGERLAGACWVIDRAVPSELCVALIISPLVFVLGVSVM